MFMARASRTMVTTRLRRDPIILGLRVVRHRARS